MSPLNAVVGLEYLQPAERWGANLVARGAQRQDDLDESGGALLSPPGYVVFDAFGFWKPAESLRLRAGLYNVGDRDYTSYVDVRGVPADTANPDRFQRPGRHFSVAVDWSF